MEGHLNSVSKYANSINSTLQAFHYSRGYPDEDVCFTHKKIHFFILNYITLDGTMEEDGFSNISK